MARGGIKGITIEIGGDTTSLDKALSSVNKNAKSIQNELKQVDKLLKLDPTNTELLAQKQKLLAEAINTTKEKLNTLKTAEEQAQQQFAKGEISEQQYRELQREIIATEQQLESLEQQAKNCNSTLVKVSEATGKIGDKAVEMGKGLMPLTTALAGVGTAAGAAAISYESAFAGVKKTTDELLDANGNVIISYDDLSNGIREMAKRMPQSASEIAGVAEAAGQLGVSTEDLLDFTETMVMLGDTTNLSAEEAATSIAKFTNITGTSRAAASNLGSTLVALGNNSATTEADILAMGNGLASAGNQIGMTDAEILGLSAALSSLGIEAQAGGTAFSKVMKQMQIDVETGGGNIENFASVAGMSVTEFSDLFRNDAASALTAFITGLGDTESMGMSTIAMLDEMGLTEARVSDALMRTSNANELLTDSLDLARGAWEENGALETEAQTRYETMASKISMVKNQIVDLGIQIGEILMPYIEKLVEKVSNVVQWFSDLSESQKKTMVAIAGVVAAIGPALIIFGKVMQGISGITSAITKVGPAIKAVKTAFTALKAAFVANPIGIVIAAIAALIAIFVVAYNKCEWFRDMVDEAFAEIKAAIGEAIEAVKPIIEDLKKSLQNTMEAIKPIIQQVIQAFQNLMTALKPVAEFIINVVVAKIKSLLAILPNIVSAVKNVIDFVTNIINAFMALFKGDFEGFKQYISAAFQNIKDYITNIVTAIVTFVVTFLENMGVNIKQIFSNIWQAIVGVFQGIGQWFADRWNDIVTAFSTAATWFQTMFQTAWDNIVAIFSAIGQWFAARWLDVQNALSAVATWFLTMFQNAWNNIVSVFSGIGQWFSARWTDIQNAFSSVVTFFQTTFNNAWNAIKNAFSSVGSFFGDLWNNIVTRFTDIGVKIGDAVGGAFKSIVNGVLGTAENIINGFLNMINGAISVIDAIPGVNISSVGLLSFPRLAKGGVLKNGQAIMAEAGPELISMVNGEAIVTPLTRSAKNTAVESAGGVAAAGLVQNLNITSPTPLTPAEVARQTRNATRRMVLQLGKG